MSSNRVEEIYNKIGTHYAFKISREAVLKEMNRLPEGAAVWAPYGMGEYDARQVLRDELWKRVEAHVQKYMYAPDGKTLIEVK